jgi:hypothetical protein
MFMGFGTFISITKTVYYFVVEIIFDSSEEKSFSSDKFNTRKWVLVLLFCFSIIANIYMGMKLADVTEIAISVRAHEKQLIKKIKRDCGIKISPYRFKKK